MDYHCFQALSWILASFHPVQDDIHPLFSCLLESPKSFSMMLFTILAYLELLILCKSVLFVCEFSVVQFSFQANSDSQSWKYVWRIDLGQTEKYWSGWFKGLSNIFLNCPVPKMLLLAGIDRLDRDLTVGQMQGES
jgi:hypothetical protein